MFMPMVQGGHHFAPAAIVTFTATAVDAVNRTTYSYSSQSFGDADASRIVVVGISHGGTVTEASGVTIGGVSATKAIGVTGGSGGAVSSIWYAEVPTGTTGTIAATISGGAGQCAISVFAVIGANSTPTDTGSHTGSVMTANDTINVSDGGVIIGNQNSSPHAAPTRTHSWTNLTERADAQLEGDRSYSAASDAFETGETGRSITCTPSGSLSGDVGFVLVSFGP